MIYVRGGKGKKNRTTTLSNELIILLRKYFHIYKPKVWLFEGIEGGIYNKRSVQDVFYKALRKSNIDKKYLFIDYAIVLQPIWLSKEKICVIFRRFWDIIVQRQLKFILM